MLAFRPKLPILNTGNITGGREWPVQVRISKWPIEKRVWDIDQ